MYEEEERVKQQKTSNTESGEKGSDVDLLVVRGADAITRLSSNLILVKTNPDEKLTRVDKRGGERRIKVKKTTGTVLETTAATAIGTETSPSTGPVAARGPPGPTIADGRVRHQRPTIETHQKEKGATDKAGKLEGGHHDERSTSPIVHVSLPPESPGLDVEVDPIIGAEKGDGIDRETQDDISRFTEAFNGIKDEKDEKYTSLTSNLKDIIPRLLNIDHNNKYLKIEKTHLREQLAKAQSEIERLQAENDAAQKNTGDVLPNSKNAEAKSEESDVSNIRHVKTRRQLKKALDANEAWNIYSQNQHLSHLRQMKIKDDLIRDLEGQIKDHKAKNLEQENKILHERHQHMEEEHKKIMKLAKGLHKEKGDLQIEIHNLKKEMSQQKKDRTSKDATERTNVKAAEVNPITTAPAAQSNLLEANENINPGNPFRSVESEAAAPIAKEKKDYDAPKVKPPVNPPVKEAETPVSVKPKQPRDSQRTPDDIFLLQAQIKQYHDDFHRERRDRERAFGEMHDIKRELESTKLMLHQKEQLVDKKKGKFPNPLKLPAKLRKDPDRRKAGSEGGLRLMTPANVTEHQERLVTEGSRYIYQGEDGANHVYHEITE